MTDFLLFQQYFTEYQKIFGLNGYRVYFLSEPLGESFADICIDQQEMVATVRFNSKLSKKDRVHLDIRQTAEHEAVHLLVGRLEKRARDRYTSPDEIYEATEELVRRIEGLVKEER